MSWVSSRDAVSCAYIEESSGEMKPKIMAVKPHENPSTFQQNVDRMAVVCQSFYVAHLICGEEVAETEADEGCPDT